MPTRRDIYLRIEPILAYSPVNPDDDERNPYRRDCLRNMDHEDGTIPDPEVIARTLDALVYREYVDGTYTTPDMSPLVAADINEPRPDRRVPSALIYTKPGERLYIHVLNSDDQPHSFHLHGLHYGIDSDGSWPLGVTSADGRRSDEICPGESWTYVFDAKEDTIGAWPFHDHYRRMMDNVNRGLFGAVIVRDRKLPEADYEVPLFFHRLAGPRGASLFDSGTLNPGDTFSYQFTQLGDYQYICRFHPMSGTIHVVAAGGLPAATVQILDGPSRFQPNDVTVQQNAIVTWQQAAMMQHTVTEAGGGARESTVLNGRAFVGNAPTIVADTGKRIRWYVFNLDLDMEWHNFHPHGMRWQHADEIIDVRSLSPAESFVADTIVPPVVLPRSGGDGDGDDGDHGDPGDEGRGKHGQGESEPGHRSTRKRKGSEESGDDGGKRVRLRGDFLVHCHVEPHMMDGMAAVVRAIQEVRMTDAWAAELGFVLPLDDGSNDCPVVDPMRCESKGGGSWESLPDSPVFVVHAAVLHTGKVLLYSGTAEVGYPLESRVWDPATNTFTAQNYNQDLFCSGHAFLTDGRLCVVGGAPSGTLKATHIFDPVTETWSQVSDMHDARWYPTVLTLEDGRIMAVSGSGSSTVEIYDAGADTWTTVAGANRYFPELYPSLHLLPSGEIFYSRSGWSIAAGTQTAYLQMTGPAAGSWIDMGQQQFYDRQEGTAVMSIDDSVTPRVTKILIIGGGVSGGPAVRNPQSLETIDLSTLAPEPSWNRGADMNYPRTNVNGTLLPDGTVLVVGGQRAGKWNATDPKPVLVPEIYDPQHGTWTTMAPMLHPRQYHSEAVLLPDGRVLSAGGIDPTKGGPPARDQRYLEVFSPPYLGRGPRPSITGVPAHAAYGANFDITTPDAARVASVALLRPCAMTHHTDAGQRYIKLKITGTAANKVTVHAPDNGRVAPPGHYMLFIVDTSGIPSIATFVQIS